MRHAAGNAAPTLPQRRRRGGFTLMEAALVTVIVSVGIMAMLQLLAAGTVANSGGTELTTAINLADNIREMSSGLAFYDPQQPTVWNTKEATVKQYDNLMDLDGPTDTWNQSGDPDAGYQVFSPPLDVRRNPMTNYPGWAQWVKVESVAPGSVATLTAQDPTAPTARVTVKIVHNGTAVYRLSWLAVAPKEN